MLVYKSAGTQNGHRDVNTSLLAAYATESGLEGQLGLRKRPVEGWPVRAAAREPIPL